MNIINPTLTTNVLTVIPRDYQSIASIEVVFTNEDTKVSTTVIPSAICTKTNNLVLDIAVPTFIEGERYTFDVRQFSTTLVYNKDNRNWCQSDSGLLDTTIIFKGKALVTEFEFNNYTINNNEFDVDIDTDSDIMKVYE